MLVIWVFLVLQENPTLDEFEQQILAYKENEEKIKLEDEKMNVGSICLLTGKQNKVEIYARVVLEFTMEINYEEISCKIYKTRRNLL